LSESVDVELTMAPGWEPSGDHDPVWRPDGTSSRLAHENVELPLDGVTPATAHVALGCRVDHLLARRIAGRVHHGVSDGRAVRRLRTPGSVRDWGGSPAWSPSGDRIAFITHVRSPGFSSAELRVLDVATGSVTLPTRSERGTTFWVIGFSAQGDRILFRRDEEGEGQGAPGESSLWSIGVDGSDARLVVAGTWQGEWLSR
jgi:hypothetical protein